MIVLLKNVVHAYETLKLRSKTFAMIIDQIFLKPVNAQLDFGL